MTRHIGWRLPDECPTCHIPYAPVRVNVDTGTCYYLCQRDLTRWIVGYYDLAYMLGEVAYQRLRREARMYGPVQPMRGGPALSVADWEEERRLRQVTNPPQPRDYRDWEGGYRSARQGVAS